MSKKRQYKKIFIKEWKGEESIKNKLIFYIQWYYTLPLKINVLEAHAKYKMWYNFVFR